MKKIALSLVFLTLIVNLAPARLPERTPENLAKYKQLCRDHIYKDMKGMYREAGGSLKYPFLAPGSSQYLDMLWDWDSWLSDVALRQILLERGSDKDRQQALAYEQGCVLNALSYGGMDGWIPIWIERKAPSRAEMLQGKNLWKSNMHKPTLAQHAAFIVRNDDGNAEWLREGFYTLQAFVDLYLNYHRNKATGLMYWQNDQAIGVDTDPSTFYRPDGSSASIFLNAMMYKELQAMDYLASRLDQPEIAARYRREAEGLLQAVRTHCWDPRDGFYYSVDLNLRPVETPDPLAKPGTFFFHTGQPRGYDGLIQRISVWSGFLSLWAGIATPEQAARIVKGQYRDTASFNAPAGLRTLSPLEKMYDLRASGNPSSWNGPVWIVANYLTFRGLVRYGYTEDARELAERTVLLLGSDYERFGALHEYYLPDNGEPVLNKGFQNWNLLVLNMMAWLDNKPIVEEF